MSEAMREITKTILDFFTKHPDKWTFWDAGIFIGKLILGLIIFLLSMLIIWGVYRLVVRLIGGTVKLFIGGKSKVR